MRYIVLLLLTGLLNVCVAQHIRVKVYRTRACSTDSRPDTSYALYPVPGNMDTAYTPQNGVTFLRKPGKYHIMIYNIAPDANTIIDIPDTGLFVFRFKEPDLGLVFTGALDTPPLYEKCDTILNGYVQLFYSNGNPKMIGDFAGGLPKDSMITYYANGALESREHIFRKKTVFEKFDSLSQRIKIIESEKGPVTLYRWRKTTEFFADGRIKLKESEVNHVHRIEAYYPNGQLKIRQTKKRRIEYLENGAKSVIFRGGRKLNYLTYT